ncbi:MAG: rnhA operon protein [Halovenus sp.]
MAEDGQSRKEEQSSDAAIPSDVADEAERLTRRARRATVEREAAAYRDRRARLLAEYDYRARIRDRDREVLVLYPDEWVEDGVVVPDRIDDLDRGVERPLEGPGEADDWETIADHNRDLADAVEREHGEVHGANAHALADFMSNHYAKPIEAATERELTEFLTDYFVRNAWPSDDQKAAVRESVRLVYESAGEPAPL